MKESRLMYFLTKIWPTVYRILNTVLYFILSLIKEFFSYAIRQIKEF